MRFPKSLLVLLTLSLSSQLIAGEVDVIAANVVKVGSDKYQFSATLKHADTGWEHYANKWEVVGLDGTIYGTRILHHPHVNEQPFTRSLSNVSIPKGEETVIIRAFDSIHEDGGKVFKLSLPK